ncbi:MAG: hypothetical protein JXC36_06555 [Candidatus Atribacteria bacterium]|nr:hypothetical protein [Candidatus Atribacteria bacterium]
MKKRMIQNNFLFLFLLLLFIGGCNMVPPSSFPEEDTPRKIKAISR